MFYFINIIFKKNNLVVILMESIVHQMLSLVTSVPHRVTEIRRQEQHTVNQY